MVPISVVSANEYPSMSFKQYLVYTSKPAALPRTDSSVMYDLNYHQDYV